MIKHISNLISPLTVSEIADLNVKHEGKWRFVFNPDNSRLQCNVEFNDAMVQHIWKKLSKHGFTRGRMYGGAVIMKSLPGCKQQPWHCDYDPSIKYNRHKPVGVLIAFEDNTRFVTPTKTFLLSGGDAIVFEADVVHAGAEYEEENMRMHFYLDTVTIKNKNNKTYLVLDT